MRQVAEDDFATLPPTLHFAGGKLSLGGLPAEPSGRSTFQCEHCMSILRAEPVATGVKRAENVDERVEARRLLEFWKGRADMFLRDSMNLKTIVERDRATEAFLDCAKQVAFYASKAGIR